MRNRYQLVWWWPEWKGIGRRRFVGSWAGVYRWSVWLGFVEVRRWAPFDGGRQ